MMNELEDMPDNDRHEKRGKKYNGPPIELWAVWVVATKPECISALIDYAETHNEPIRGNGLGATGQTCRLIDDKNSAGVKTKCLVKSFGISYSEAKAWAKDWEKKNKKFGSFGQVDDFSVRVIDMMVP